MEALPNKTLSVAGQRGDRRRGGVATSEWVVAKAGIASALI